MRRSGHTDDEISFLLAEAETGIPIDDICRTAHISLRTFYRWRKRFGGLDREGVERLHILENENRSLRQQLLGLMRTSRKATAFAPGGSKPRSEFCDVAGNVTPGSNGSGLTLGRYSNVRMHQGR